MLYRLTSVRPRMWTLWNVYFDKITKFFFFFCGCVRNKLCHKLVSSGCVSWVPNSSCYLKNYTPRCLRIDSRHLALPSQPDGWSALPSPLFDSGVELKFFWGTFFSGGLTLTFPFFIKWSALLDALSLSSGGYSESLWSCLSNRFSVSLYFCTRVLSSRIRFYQSS